MIKKEDIEKIIKAGSLAPSGSNSQPWNFSVKNGTVTVYAQYEKDHPILNYRNRGTLLAHGALLENMHIAAAALGYKASVRLFPQGGSNPIGEVTFTDTERSKQDLYEAINRREINRRPYRAELLDPQVKERLLEGVQSDQVRLIEDKEGVVRLAEAASISERLMFESEELHKLLVEEIVWSEAEERIKKTGLFVKTMELNGPQRMVLRLLRSWAATRCANRLGFSKVLAAGNAKVYEMSAAMGIISASDDDQSFIEAGRVMERLWLRATKEGLRFHILTGVGFFWQRMFLGGDKNFSEQHKTLVGEAYDTIKKVGRIEGDGIPAIVFRVGYGNAPTARSSKKDPEIVFE